MKEPGYRVRRVVTTRPIAGLLQIHRVHIDAHAVAGVPEVSDGSAQAHAYPRKVMALDEPPIPITLPSANTWISWDQHSLCPKNYCSSWNCRHIRRTYKLPEHQAIAHTGLETQPCLFLSRLIDMF